MGDWLHLSEPRQVRQARRVNRWFLGGVFIEFGKNLRAEYMKIFCWKEAYPGVETSFTPVEPDVLDGDDGVESVPQPDCVLVAVIQVSQTWATITKWIGPEVYPRRWDNNYVNSDKR